MDFKAILEMMVKRRASDLFITAGRAPSIKVDGALIEISKTVLTAEQAFMVVTSIMDNR